MILSLEKSREKISNRWVLMAAKLKWPCCSGESVWFSPTTFLMIYIENKRNASQYHVGCGFRSSKQIQFGMQSLVHLVYLFIFGLYILVTLDEVLEQFLVDQQLFNDNCWRGIRSSCCVTKGMVICPAEGWICLCPARKKPAQKIQQKGKWRLAS